MVTLAVLSNISPSSLSVELGQRGYEVLESVSFSEILHLCEHRSLAAVIIAYGVEVLGLSDLAQHQMVLEQHAECITEQLVQTLTMMFGHNAWKQ